jgi:hypothetical protein
VLTDISSGLHGEGTRRLDLLGNGDKVGAVRGVYQSVVEVLVGNKGGVELAVVDPDVGAFLRQSPH